MRLAAHVEQHEILANLLFSLLVQGEDRSDKWFLGSYRRFRSNITLYQMASQAAMRDCLAGFLGRKEGFPTVETPQTKKAAGRHQVRWT